MSVNIIPVQSKKEWTTFVNFPYRHYGTSPFWVAPLLMDQKVLLDTQKNPFFKHAEAQFFLAEKEGKIAGRIAAIVDERHNEVHLEKMGFFGFFETINDSTVSGALLAAAKDWIREKGMTALRGPVNPCLNEDCGLLIDAFDSPPVLMMPYNYDYYPRHIEQFGLKKVMDLWAYYMDDSNPPPKRLVRAGEAIRRRRKITILPIDKKNYREEVQKVKMIYNKAWEKNWGFIPMTDDEFDHLAKNLKTVIMPEMALMAEVNGEPVGFSLALPDMNQALIRLKGRLLPTGLLKLLYYEKKIDMARVIIMGVIPEYRNLGVDALFYLDTWKNGTEKGFRRAEMSWILETNTLMNRALQMLDAKIYKTYRLYQMPL